MDNELIFIDNNWNLCGYCAGMSEQEIKDYCIQNGFKIELYKNFVQYWDLKK
jgi:hypothetical protein